MRVDPQQYPGWPDLLRAQTSINRLPTSPSPLTQYHSLSLTMASSYSDPLLSSSIKRVSFPCKALLITLSFAAVICLSSLITLQLISSNTRNIIYSSPEPSHLCTNSPNPSTCHAIVFDILTHTSYPNPTPLHVLNSLVAKLLRQINSAELLITKHSANSGSLSGGQSALSDCAQLLDMSRDRLMGSIVAVATGAHVDARTWLSAALAYHATCLDGLDGPEKFDLEPHLNVIMDHASASLAVLNAISSGDETDRSDSSYVVERVLDFPSWMPFHDKKLLEAPVGVDGIAANVVVAQDGSGKYRKVQDAVTAAPNKSKSRYVIYVKKGVYKENVVIPKSKTNLMIVGDGMTATILTGSLNVVDGCTTFKSATLAANGDGLILQDLGIQNTAGAIKHQAVALRVSGDHAAINRCKIDAYQDTLYAHTLRQFYRDSNVSGTVDFIFGNAAVVLQNCNLIARRPMDNQQNLVTAQGRTDPNQNTGTSIQNCKIIPSSDLAPVKGKIPTYLGRPWKQYSRTVVMQSYIDDHVNPLGWAPWDGDFALKTLFYGEYQNTGPGAGTAGRVKWPGYKVIKDAKTASSFTVAGLIQGGTWLKSTGVDYTEGLFG